MNLILYPHHFIIIRLVLLISFYSMISLDLIFCTDIPSTTTEDLATLYPRVWGEISGEQKPYVYVVSPWDIDGPGYNYGAYGGYAFTNSWPVIPLKVQIPFFLITGGVAFGVYFYHSYLIGTLLW